SVTNMYSMFHNCSNLTTLDVSGFDTSSVTDMESMFDKCSNLTTLDVSSFDTSSVTDMGGMFSGCSNLTTLDVSSLDTSKVTSMNCMFYDCSNLTTLDVSSLDTSKVTSMNGMFYDCSNLTTLDVSGFDTSSVTDMVDMFLGCSNLITLDLSSFDTSGVTDMRDMFSGCYGLTTIYTPCNVTQSVELPGDLRITWYRSDDDTVVTELPKNLNYSVTLKKSVNDIASGTSNNISWVIDGNKKLTVTGTGDFERQDGQYAPWYDYRWSIKSAEVSVTGMTDASHMFSGCEILITLDLSSFDTSSVTDMGDMFSRCSDLTTLDVSNFNTRSVTNMGSMFESCFRLSTLNLSNFNTGSVTDMSDMFSGCSDLTTLDVSSFDTSSVTNMSHMFAYCPNLTTLDVSSFDTSKVTSMHAMFFGCSNLTTLDVSSFDTSSVTYMSDMFYNCSSLTALDVSSFDTSSVTDMFEMFFGCSNLTELNVSNFNTYSVTDMGGMFFRCSNLTTLDVSSFNTGNVTSMEAMFYDCSNLTTLDASSFNTGNVTGMGDMFSNCSNLTTLDLSSFDTSSVSYMDDMFTGCSALSTIYTPRNLKLSVELPVNSGDIWYRSDGTVVTILPMNLSYSVALGRNYTPTEKAPDDDPKDDDGVLDEDIPEDGIIPEGLWISQIADQTYTGAAIKPEVRVYDGEKRLKQGIDYTLSYKNNTIAAGDADTKPPTVVVKGKGNYSGTETKTFTITKRDISDTYVTKTFTDAYTPLANGKNPTLVFAAKCNNKALKKNTDYTLTVKDSDGKEVTSYGTAGTYTAVIKGTGKNYTGECSFSFEVLDKVPVSKLKIGKIAAVKYDGTGKTPEPVIKYGKLTLGKGTDYTLSYQNNTEIGTATIIISGMGDYFGTRNVTFAITGLPIKKAKFTGFINAFPYTGDKVYQSKVVLKYGENNLVEGRDYTVSYSNYLNKGKATATYTGIGAYTGSIKKTYNITAYNIAKDSQKRIKLSTDAISAVYTKGGATPSLKVYDGTQLLTEGKDYTLSYQNNAAVTTSATVKQPTIMVKGKGNYSGAFSEKKTFTITAKDIAEVTVTTPDVAASQKTGKYKSTPVLTDTNGKKLKAGTDYDKTYTYTYKNKTEKVLNNGTEVTRNAGDLVDAKDITPANTVLCVHIKAKEGGNYTGEKTADYRVTASLISKAKITVQNPAQNNTNLFPYTGQAIRLDKSNLIVKVGKEVLSEDQYEILEDTYKNNVGKGTASVQIKGVRNYGGTATVKFKIGTKGFQWVKRLFG
ncbi:MAG: BspA family leucine-rich repeat surface protein, partial [Lachnospiraceae bacterium]|nr:BspA family leucine-rich repeat surface protein [Lachnospiraceae bacterium]